MNDYIDDENTELYDSPPTEELLTIKETAQLLGVSIATLHSWRKRGFIQAYSLGHTRAVRFKRAEVIAAMNSATVLTRI